MSNKKSKKRVHVVGHDRLFELGAFGRSADYDRICAVSSEDDGLRQSVRVASSLMKFVAKDDAELTTLAYSQAQALKTELSGSIGWEEACWVACCTKRTDDLSHACALLDKHLAELDEQGDFSEQETSYYRMVYNTARDLTLITRTFASIPPLVSSYRLYMAKQCGLETPTTYLKNLGLDIALGNDGICDTVLFMKMHQEFCHQFDFQTDYTATDYAYALKAARKRRSTMAYDEFFEETRPSQGVLFE